MEQQPQSQQPAKPAPTVWNYALKGLKWGIYAGIGLKGLDTFLLLLKADMLTAILFLIVTLVIIGMSFAKEVYQGVIIFLVLLVSRFTRMNLFIVFLGSGLAGAILGALPGMAIGAMVGLLKKKNAGEAGTTQANSTWVIVKSLVLPLVGAVALFTLYFGVVNPWLYQVMGGGEKTTAPVVQTTPVKTTTSTPAVVYGSISGKVLDDNKKPISGAYVTATAFESGSSGGGSAATDSSGNYQIKNLTSGNYRVWATNQDRLTQYWQNSANFTSAAAVSVTAPKDKGSINFTLALSGKISGSVTSSSGQPLPGITVVVIPVGGGMGFGMDTDANGAYTIGGFALGAYQIEARPGSRSNPADNYVTMYYNNKLGSNNADVITFTNDNPAFTGINFKLEIGGSISGQVLDDKGQPFVHAYVWASLFDSDNKQGSGAYTDSSGNYRFKGLASGKYRVCAYYTGWTTQYWQNAVYSGATPVTVTSSDEKSGINFTLKPSGTSATP